MHRRLLLTVKTVEATTATPNAPVQTAHDDFDWSVDKRNVTSYTKEEKEKYDKVYDNTFVQLNDGELMKGTRGWFDQNRCGTEHRFQKRWFDFTE